MCVLLEAVPLRRIADRLDQVIALSLFVLLCIQMLPQGFPPPHLYPLMLLVSEAVVVLFLLIRRSTDKISLSLRDWIIALGGTFAPFLVGDPGVVFLPGLGSAMILAGFVIHVGAKLNLRRSFGLVPADRGLQAEGLYRFVRHPMYAGYMVTHMGFLIAAPAIWNAFAYTVCWGLLATRMILEERFLSLNPDYRAYCSKVRFRLVPGVL